MHDLGRNEDRLRGTYEFPFEFHHIDSTHPRYVMSYHWHVECEIMRVLQGTLTVTLDEKSFTAKAGDVIFVNSGVLHSGIPQDCIYQCIVFDMNMFLKFNSVCTEYMQKISHQELLIYHRGQTLGSIVAPESRAHQKYCSQCHRSPYISGKSGDK